MRAIIKRLAAGIIVAAIIFGLVQWRSSQLIESDFNFIQFAFNCVVGGGVLAMVYSAIRWRRER